MRNTAIAGLIILMGLLAGSGLAADQKITGAGKTRPEAVYHYCSVCHGDRGNGLSRARNSLVPAPRDFTAPGMKFSRDYMITVTRDGKPGTAMVGWKTQLSEQDIAGVVDYIRTANFVPSVLMLPQPHRTTATSHPRCRNARPISGHGAPHWGTRSSLDKPPVHSN